jgi:uncharacterized protein
MGLETDTGGDLQGTRLLIAVDTNLLVYAHRSDSPFHEAAYELMDNLRRGRAPWAIPWSCLHEFIAVVTHPKIFKQPTAIALAFDAIDAWLAGGNAQLIGESEGYLEKLRAQAVNAKARGPRIHDARIAAICLHHGIRELFSADRDLRRFPDLPVRNPLLHSIHER